MQITTRERRYSLSGLEIKTRLNLFYLLSKWDKVNLKYAHMVINNLL